MGLASRDETPTVVTTVRTKAGIVPVYDARPLSIVEHIDSQCERLGWVYGLTDWLLTTTQTKQGWVASCVLTRFELGEQTVGAVVASAPRATRDEAEGYVLGQLLMVGK